jgi:hypothetical protein
MTKAIRKCRKSERTPQTDAFFAGHVWPRTVNFCSCYFVSVGHRSLPRANTVVITITTTSTIIIIVTRRVHVPAITCRFQKVILFFRLRRLFSFITRLFGYISCFGFHACRVDPNRPLRLRVAIWPPILFGRPSKCHLLPSTRNPSLLHSSCIPRIFRRFSGRKVVWVEVINSDSSVAFPVCYFTKTSRRPIRP